MDRNERDRIRFESVKKEARDFVYNFLKGNSKIVSKILSFADADLPPTNVNDCMHTVEADLRDGRRLISLQTLKGPSSYFTRHGLSEDFIRLLPSNLDAWQNNRIGWAVQYQKEHGGSCSTTKILFLEEHRDIARFCAKILRKSPFTLWQDAILGLAFGYGFLNVYWFIDRKRQGLPPYMHYKEVQVI